VFQFALSTLMIVSTVAVYFQVRYILEKDLGLNRENVVSLELEGAVKNRYEAFRQELLTQPGILNASASNANPLYIGQNTTFDMHWEGRDPDDKTVFAIIAASYDFVETMNMQILDGRAHFRKFGSDSAGYVINEQMADLMGKEDPIGENLSFWGQSGHVIGVVKDFQTTTMEASIAPTVIRLEPEGTHTLWVRAEPGRIREALANLETVHKQFNPEYPFAYTFLDKTYETLYRDVLVMGNLASVFAVIAIFISCLGLFGLASFTAEQRTKEIGIRKVLGASVSGLALSFSLNFTRLVLLGIVLAMPVAYYVIHAWLARYQYHAELGIGIFILAGSAAVLIAWLTVGYQSIKAALADPVKSLRYE
jgi:hypothetical protein